MHTFFLDSSSWLKFNIPYITYKTAGMTKKLVACLQQTKLISNTESNTIIGCRDEIEKWNKLSSVLRVKRFEDVQTLANCFRDLKLNDVANVLEFGGG